MSEINVSKQITEQEIRKNLEKELELMQIGEKLLDNVNKLMNESFDICMEIEESMRANREYLQYFKGRDKYNNNRTQVTKECIEIRKHLREIYDIVFNLFY